MECALVGAGARFLPATNLFPAETWDTYCQGQWSCSRSNRVLCRAAHPRFASKSAPMQQECGDGRKTQAAGLGPSCSQRAPSARSSSRSWILCWVIWPCARRAVARRAVARRAVARREGLRVPWHERDGLAWSSKRSLVEWVHKRMMPVIDKATVAGRRHRPARKERRFPHKDASSTSAVGNEEVVWQPAPPGAAGALVSSPRTRSAH